MSQVPQKDSVIAVIDLGDCRTAEGQKISGHYATRRLAGQPLPDRIARRLSDATRIDRIVITGTRVPAPVLTGSLADVSVLDLPFTHTCERLASAADRFDASWVVYVPGNHPFIDPALVDCLVNRAIKSPSTIDYIGYCGHDGDWGKVRQLGVSGEVCHADALRRLRRNVDRLPRDDRQDRALVDWLQAAPGEYIIKHVAIPDALDHHDLRFAIEDESDWECAELFSDTMQNDDTEWQLLANLVRDNASLRETMAKRNGFTQSANSA